MLKLFGVTKSYQQKLVIDNASYNFNEKRYCITGQNGSGKTTFLLLAAGVEPATRGCITLDDLPIDITTTKRKLGISSDKILLPSFLTPQQLLDFHCSSHDCVFPTQLIHALNFSKHLMTQVSALSLGNLKKISLLLAIAHQPQCVLLDEPTTGLDDESKTCLLAYLQDYNGQIIITSHEAVFINDPTFKQVLLTSLKKPWRVNDD